MNCFNDRRSRFRNIEVPAPGSVFFAYVCYAKDNRTAFNCTQ